MLKKTITYTDFNDNQRTKDLYFHISRTELMDHIDMISDLEGLRDDLESAGPDTSLKMEDIKKIIDLVKTFMKIAYGKRSEDGDRFSKSEDIWLEFKESAVYDAFFYSLFEKPEEAVRFLVEIVPKELREAAEAEVEKRTKVTEVVPGASTADDVSELEAALEELKRKRAAGNA